MCPQFHWQTPLIPLNSFLTHQNFKHIDPSLCLQPHFLTPSELLILQTQTQKFAQMPNIHINQTINDVKNEFPVKFEGKFEHIPKPAKLELSDKDFSYSESDISLSHIDQSLNQTDVKPEVEKIVRFLLSSMGKDNEALVGKARSYYLYNPSLLQVLEKLSQKFYCARKHKEDLIRNILRKIFRHLRTSIMKKEKVNSKKASLLLCKKYFEKLNPESSEVEDDEKLLESFMPYKKNSKNETMNISFILEIFSSPSFYQEYQEFLPRLNTLFIEENKRKEKKLVNYIMDCIEKNSLEKLNTMQRLPWLDVWIEDAKNLAVAIMPNKRLIYNSKKPKNYSY